MSSINSNGKPDQYNNKSKIDDVVDDNSKEYIDHFEPEKRLERKHEQMVLDLMVIRIIAGQK